MERYHRTDTHFVTIGCEPETMKTCDSTATSMREILIAASGDRLRIPGLCSVACVESEDSHGLLSASQRDELNRRQQRKRRKPFFLCYLRVLLFNSSVPTALNAKTPGHQSADIGT